MTKATVVVGFDQREAIAYHVFCQSIIERTSIPIQFLPLATQSLHGYRETHTDGSNAFIYSRFLTPYLMGYKGVALFADGDMICRADIAELFELFDPNMAVQVVKHDYRTKKSQKYLGNKNEDYPRKNWSSVILWNCEHPDNRCLTPALIQSSSGSYLHRFSWLSDELIGALPMEWNWLATEYPDNPEAKLVHYTLGTPCFKDYQNSEMSSVWWEGHTRVNDGLGV